MMAFAVYLLKVFVCSGSLFLYYILALKDRLFHQWNRFYLLSAVVLSIVFPLLQFAVLSGGEEQGKAVQLLQVVQSADDYLEAFTVSAHPHFSFEQWLIVGYCLLSLVLFSTLLLSLFRIKALAKKWGVERVERIKFVNTTEPSAPFSFLNYIFWHKGIPLWSETGQQIFRHEAVHVNEKHTLDKLFGQIVLIPFWCNPFFWLIKRELRFIHEFIADKKSVSANDTAAFAAMILQASYPKQYSSIANPFFQTSIKRRLAMLTKTENPKLAYISRLVALPLIALLAFAFTVRTKSPEKVVKLDKEFVVVIDAGHGYDEGKPTGVQIDAVNESDIVLSLANKMKDLNNNRDLKLVFTRTDRNLVDLKKRVEITKAAGADLFISLHVAAADNTTEKGMQIYLPPASKPTTVQNNLLGSAIIANLKSIYSTTSQPLQRKNAIYVLDQSPCPAALVECGYLTNEGDRSFLQSAKNQEQLAKQLLQAIENYATSSTKDHTQLTNKDTMHKNGKEISSMDVNTIRKEFTLQYKNGTSETIMMEEAKKRGYVNDNILDDKKQTVAQNDHANLLKPIYLLDGKETKEEEILTLDPKTIESINILKDASAIQKYGDKGKNGVVEIKRKGKPSDEKITISDNNKPIMKGEVNRLERKGNSVNIEAKLESIDVVDETGSVFQ